MPNTAFFKNTLSSYVNGSMIGKVFHGSYCIVKEPHIHSGKFNKDFGNGFYVTLSEQQAVKFTKKFKDTRIVNSYDLLSCDGLNIKVFNNMNDEWLDFIASCRAGISHEYDIVEGPMADDQVWEHAQDYIDGIMSKELFWAHCRFVYPTHQICLCSERALKLLQFSNSYEVN